MVVNLYPFAEAAARPGIDLDELIEEIDIGGPTLVRAAAKNHASVAILTSPDQYRRSCAELGGTARWARAPGGGWPWRPSGCTAAYDGRIAAELGRRLGDGLDGETADGAGDRCRPASSSTSSGSSRLRYGENPHQVGGALPAPRRADPGSGPFAAGVDLLQGKALSYNNLLDAAAAAGVARDLRGRRHRHRQARQPLWRGGGRRPPGGLGRGPSPVTR